MLYNKIFKKLSKEKQFKLINAQPAIVGLSGLFLIVSIIGFLGSAYYAVTSLFNNEMKGLYVSAAIGIIGFLISAICNGLGKFLFKFPDIKEQ